jgi:hypothetical protein
MSLSDNETKKTIGEQPEKRPLQRLRELNLALKKLGCQNKPEKTDTVYRKIVGQR